MDFFNFFDGYGLRARVYPALLTLLPALAVVLAWFPSLLTSGTGAAIIMFVNACGLLFLLAELSRSQGHLVQTKLLEKWGGFPTIRILRHGDQTVPAEVKGRYHAFLAAKCGVSMPTAAEEEADAAAADARYSSAILWLKEQCRDAEHSLILNENTSYGFRRNLLGLKAWGIALSLSAALWPFGLLAWEGTSATSWSLSGIIATLAALEPVQVGSTVLGLIGLICWIFVVRGTWVKEMAELYALRLLAACDFFCGDVRATAERPS